MALFRLIVLRQGLVFSGSFGDMDALRKRATRDEERGNTPLIYGDAKLLPAFTGDNQMGRLAQAVALAETDKASWWDVRGKKVAHALLAHAGQATSSPARPARPAPQVPPEIWAKPIPGMDYMAAVRAMCGEGVQ